MKRFSSLLCLLLAACVVQSSPGGSTSSASSVSSVSSAVSTLPPGMNKTAISSLKVPDGFHIEEFATDLSGARVIVQDALGNFWVSRPAAGLVTTLEMSGSVVRQQYDIFRGLRNPHGLALDPDGRLILYIAEETKILKARLYTDAPVETIATLPAGGRHTSRTIEFGPDGRLYVSIGSTCDVCVEANPLHGTIMSMNKDGSDLRTFATGLRNAVFFTWNPKNSSMWATDMGRDMLGDNLPPEEVDIITEGSNYGWPFCYGDRIRDTSFQPSKNVDCATTVAPKVELPAHIAPLGLSFIPEEGWPEAYWHDLLVAEHGSWNSTVPVGYKIVRVPLDARGNVEGPPVDFLTGFHNGSAALGRPVALHAQTGGVLYITDDKAGVVYRMKGIEK